MATRRLAGVQLGFKRRPKIFPPTPSPSETLPQIAAAAASSFPLHRIVPSSELSPARDSSPAATVTPLSSLLPLSLNPFNVAVDRITSRLKQQQHRDEAEIGGEAEPFLEAHLVPFLRPEDVSRVLLRCQSLPLPSLRFFRWAQSHLLPPAHSFALLAHLLASSPASSPHTLPLLSDLVRYYPDDAFQALLAAESSVACPRPAITFGMLVKVYASLGRIADAINACRRAAAAGFSPNADAFNCLLHSLAKAGSHDQCWNLYGEMRTTGVLPNTYTFNILILSLCRGSDGSARAVEFLDEMESEGFDPDVVTYNTLMDGYCRKGMLSDAFYLYRVMQPRGVEPDLISYTILTNGLCGEGDVFKARQLFDEMLHRGICPDTYSYNVLLNGYCNGGKLRKSRLLVQEMIARGLSPDNFTVGRIVETHVKSGRLLPCLNLIVLLKKVKVTIPFDVHKCLIDAPEGRPSAARSLLKQMQLDGHEPDTQISSKTLEAECLMEEMIEGSIQPDSTICAALVGGWCEIGDLHRAEAVLVFFAEMFQIHESNSYNSVMKLCCMGGDSSKAFELQDRLLRLGFIPDGETCRSLVHGLSKSRNVS
ncbi:hypothetical protein ZIOFF_017136 [Zingiber officinale]|uniref:Pentatricopeptide repeat-containing protein n=1 Tax=Zingiber officinale TaxID=94328 RepID=A0A8J5H4L3_ZINOF|nr:hypothetical protein ZIOFF_017136 [Zingiber officinale]